MRRLIIWFVFFYKELSIKIVVSAQNVCRGDIFWRTKDGRRRQATSWQLCQLEASRGLVFAFHGFGGTPMMWASAAEEVSKKNWTLIAPRGEQRSWNGKYCCGKSLERQNDDAEDIAALLDVVGRPQNVYGIGFSNGGFFITEVAAFRQDVLPLRGIAPWGGHGYTLGNHSHPTSIFLNHGDADTTVRPRGCCPGIGTKCCCGIGQAWNRPCVSVEQVFDLWLFHNHCQDKRISHSAAATCFYGINCAANSTLCIHKGLKHAIPGLHATMPSSASLDLSLFGTLFFFFDISKQFKADSPAVAGRLASAVRLLQEKSELSPSSSFPGGSRLGRRKRPPLLPTAS